MTQIPQHAHCLICGRAIQFGEKTCSKECQDALLVNAKKRNQMKWLMYIAMGLAVSLLVLQMAGRV